MQSVNTFFVMSGLLVGLLHMRELRRLATSRQWGVFALNYSVGRIVRILPNLLVVSATVLTGSTNVSILALVPHQSLT